MKSSKQLKRMTSILLAFTLLVQFCVLIAFAGGSNGLDDPAISMSGVSLEKIEPDGTYTDVTGQTISPIDSLRLTYDLRFSQSKLDEIQGEIASNGVCTMEIPPVTGLAYAQTAHVIMTDRYEFAELSVDETGSAFLTFSGDFWEDVPVSPEPGETATPDSLPSPEPSPEPGSEPESDTATDTGADDIVIIAPYITGYDGADVSLVLDCFLNMGEIGTATDYTIAAGGEEFAITVAPLMLMTFGATTPQTLNDIADNIVTTLLKEDTLNNWVQVTNRMEVSKNDNLKLEYNFNISAGNLIKIYNEITSGNPQYEIEVPILDGLTGVNSSVAIPITVQGGTSVSGSLLTLATLVINGGKAYLEFGGDFWTYVGDKIEGNKIIDSYSELTQVAVELFISCKLDSKTTTATCVIELSAGSITIVVEENKPPELEKEGVFDKNSKEITWTVKYTATATPVSFSDTFPNTYLEYVDGSLELSVNGGTSAKLNPTVNTTTIEVEVTDDLDIGSWVFTYKTRLTDAFYKEYDKNSITLKNTATVNGKTVTGSVDVAKSTLTMTKTAKNGVYGNTSAGHKIDWTITVNVGEDYATSTSLVVTDVIPDGLTLIGESVFANGATSTSVDNGKTTLEVILNKNSNGTYDNTYTITFTTLVDENWFMENNLGGISSDKKITNTAKLTVDAVGEITDDEVVTINKKIITKIGTYSPATHTFTWTVTVNPNKIDLTSGTITDTIPDGLTYVDDSFNGASGLKFVGYDNATKKLTVNIEALGETEAEFTYKTTVDAHAQYANNLSPSVPFTNTATMTGTLASGTSVADKAEAKKSVTSTVLTKGIGDAYDYVKHEASWLITVNTNAMTMTNTSLVDTIPEYQTFVEGSVEITGSPEKKIVTCVENADGTSTLTIELGKITGVVKVKYKTEVDVDNDPRFKTQGDIEITNSVTLKRDVYVDQTVDNAKQTINNTILKKTGEVTTLGRKIEFKVDINPNNMNLTGYELKDVLPAGLMLDNQSVKLYEASFNSSAGFTKGSEVTSFVWTYEPPGNGNSDSTLTVKLPEGRSYVLVYSCFVTSAQDNASYTNSISFTGSYLDASVKSEYAVTIKSGGAAKALFDSSTGIIVITKTDSKTQAALSGVEFKLYTEPGGDLVGSGTTDAGGTLTFDGLTRGAKYRIVETGGPSGYNLNYSGDITVSGANNDVYIQNDRSTGFAFEFYKLNANNSSAVRNAQFTLYKYKDMSSPLKTAVSEVNGRVYFSGLEFGQYTLVETVAPQGYYLSSTEFTVDIKSDRSYTITVSSSGQGVPKNNSGYIIYNAPVPSPPGGGGGGGTTPPPPEPEPEPEPLVEPEPEPEPGEEPLVPIPGEPEEAPAVIPPPGEPEPIVTPQGTPAVPGEVITPPRGVISHTDNGTFVLQDDGSIIEFDDVGVPLGRWTQDEEGIWIFDEDVPLGGLSQTGVDMPLIWPLMILGMWLIAAGAFLKKIRGY